MFLPIASSSHKAIVVYDNISLPGAGSLAKSFWAVEEGHSKVFPKSFVS